MEFASLNYANGLDLLFNKSCDHAFVNNKNELDFSLLANTKLLILISTTNA